jgi:light-regulated signal transduction histidine kinase (bacteriophytochrome)
LTRCEDEPIHIPGAVQGFGVLIAVHEEPETENLTVRIVSENSGLVLGLSPTYLFSLTSFTELLSQDQESVLRDHIAFCRVEQQQPNDLDGPEVFLITGKSQDDRPDWTCWCAMHIGPGTDLIVLEFELEEDHLFPLATPLDQQPGEGGRSADVEPYEPTEEDYLESTHKESKPLRLLSRRQTRINSPMEHFSILSQVNEQLAGATDIKQFVKIVVGVFKEITGFHRVMVYQVLSYRLVANHSLMNNGMDKSWPSWWIGVRLKISIGGSTFLLPISPLKRVSCTL